MKKPIYYGLSGIYRFILLFVLLIFCTGTFQMIGCKNIIMGTVTDSDNNPIRGAVVTIEGYASATTDAEGKYEIENVQYGKGIIVTATYNDSETANTTIDTSYINNGLSCEEPAANIQFGFKWKEVSAGSASEGGISNNIGDSISPQLAINNSGEYIVAWSDNSSGNHEIYVRKWNGVSWEEMGTGSASGSGISNTVRDSGLYGGLNIAINALGNPVIAWEENNYSISYIYLKQWNGTAWEELGASATGNGISVVSVYSFISLAIDKNGNPVVAWEDKSSTPKREIYLKRWNGSAWEELGGSASNGGISNNNGSDSRPSIAINDSNYPVVAWDNYPADSYEYSSIYIKEWNGSAWVEISSGSATGYGISNGLDNYASFPDLKIDDAGIINIVWQNSSVQDKIFAKQYSGLSWNDIGCSFASGDGVNSTSGDAIRASLTIDGSNNPIVAWRNDVSGNWEVYIRKWNGSSWVDICPGSASEGGISRNSGDSGGASVAINSSGNPVVAWNDDTSGNYEIYIKQYEP